MDGKVCTGHLLTGFEHTGEVDYDLNLIYILTESTRKKRVEEEVKNTVPLEIWDNATFEEVASCSKQPVKYQTRSIELIPAGFQMNNYHLTFGILETDVYHRRYTEDEKALIARRQTRQRIPVPFEILRFVEDGSVSLRSVRNRTYDLFSKKVLKVVPNKRFVESLIYHLNTVVRFINEKNEDAVRKRQRSINYMRRWAGNDFPTWESRKFCEFLQHSKRWNVLGEPYYKIRDRLPFIQRYEFNTFDQLIIAAMIEKLRNDDYRKITFRMFILYMSQMFKRFVLNEHWNREEYIEYVVDLVEWIEKGCDSCFLRKLIKSDVKGNESVGKYPFDLLMPMTTATLSITGDSEIRFAEHGVSEESQKRSTKSREAIAPRDMHGFDHTIVTMMKTRMIFKMNEHETFEREFGTKDECELMIELLRNYIKFSREKRITGRTEFPKFEKINNLRSFFERWSNGRLKKFDENLVFFAVTGRFNPLLRIKKEEGKFDASIAVERMFNSMIYISPINWSLRSIWK